MASTVLTTISLTLEAEKGLVKEIRAVPNILNEGNEAEPTKELEDPAAEKASLDGHNLTNNKTNSQENSSTNNQDLDVQLEKGAQKNSTNKREALPANIQNEDDFQEKRNEDGKFQSISISNHDQDRHLPGLSKPQKEKFKSFPGLSNPRQDILLLHGPGQRYSIEKSSDIPELKSDEEVLIQVRLKIIAYTTLLKSIGGCNRIESCGLERPVGR